jgi:hypothetical protein
LENFMGPSGRRHQMKIRSRASRFLRALQLSPIL